MSISLDKNECYNFPDNCGPLSADIEIEGVGIYISFLATALLTLSAAVIRLPCQLALHSYEYAEHAKPEYHDFDHQSNKGTAANLYHATKEKVRICRRWILLRYSNKPNMPRYRLLNAAVTPLIISLADQQLVTSSAVMIAGLYNFHKISAYHYNIIVYLAWFSSFTHTVAFVSMGDHFLQNHVLAGIRFCGYIGNFILFIFAQSRARSFGNTAGMYRSYNSEHVSVEAAACLARCAAQFPYHGYDHQLRIATLSFLFFQAFLQCIPQCIRNGFSLSIYSRCLKILCITDREPLCLWLAYAFQTVIVSFWVIPIPPILLGLGFGVRRALVFRDISRYPGLETTEDFIEQQNAWTFGQFVACILLVLPIIAALEGYLDEREKISDENREAGLPSHNSQWKHRFNVLLKVTHLGKPPTAKDPGLRNRISAWADNNSVDHPVGIDTERPSTIEMASRQNARLSQPRERQVSSQNSPRLFTHESGELVLLPHIKEISLGLDCVVNLST
ncbi:hypothetical protein BELL_0659g00080 [Botrytis elliptica]|uniref:Uncharacterized protein n=1 Tax=Botrytis elliptica TaxID=278938 RepID=A0A4Z1JNF2_9HELO|nr:hypothetical protein BELL_0659g00080 [Botrytis elliptica]